MFSVYVNWENYYEKGWENVGRSLIEENCQHKCESKFSDENNMRYSGCCEKCEFSEDSCQPMMNYAYPLETKPDDENIIKVCRETNCTVMYNENDDTFYLALCGGGMNLSQDIAFAYFILEKWIPLDLALNVSTQPDLSMYGLNFRKTMRACKESLKKDIRNAKYQIKRIDESIKKSIIKDKTKRK